MKPWFNEIQGARANFRHGLRAEIVRIGRAGDQRFYVVKTVSPCVGAASLLIGLDSMGKIAGLNLSSMVGE